ncbi:QueT transporter family protein [Liquorilactobacillus mali]|uniref:QueT transporter family protein n=1 Tax=Liquorilactobacillus mali TaxID=1618 RepID=UPI0026500223|nr:QueT transporter family protein [Liquorilactobacillus mali]MDN7145523.1 QueT transporter family protein [Liquorilactobacillus mali]MDV7757288.1 QueT transporter family protein [Liquorilactobacillus mali]
MSGNKIRFMVINAALAAIYVVITMMFSSFSFGAIQVRIATALYQLVAFNKKYYWGMVLGVVVANLLMSPFGLIDIPVGLGVTGLGLAIAIFINRKIKNINIRLLVVGMCVSLGMIFVALELFYISKAPLLITYVYLICGQLVAQVIGAVIFKIINKAINLREIMN